MGRIGRDFCVAVSRFVLEVSDAAIALSTAARYRAAASSNQIGLNQIAPKRRNLLYDGDRTV
jgi:hypothetical protein